LLIVPAMLIVLAWPANNCRGSGIGLSWMEREAFRATLTRGQMSDPAIQPIADDVLLIDGARLCRMLSISKSTMHSMRRSGKLPLKIIKLNGAVRYEASEVAEWVRLGCPSSARYRFLKESGAIGRRATG